MVTGHHTYGIPISPASNSELFVTAWKWASLECIKPSICFRSCQSGGCHLCAIPPASIKEQPVSTAAEAGASFLPRMTEAACVTLHQHDEMVHGLAPNAHSESG